MRNLMKTIALVICGFGLLLSNLAVAEESASLSPTAIAEELSEKIPYLDNIDGYLQTRNYIDASKDSDQEEFYEFRNDIRLGADLGFLDWLTGRVSAHQYLHYGLNDTSYHPEQTNFQLWEGYLDIASEKVDFRLGQQTIRWGKGDEVNPVDDFTPENLREFINYDRADRKIPILAANGTYYLSEKVRWQAVWIPFFEESKFAGTNQDWEFFFRRNYRELAGLEDIPEQRPANKLENSSYATRVVYQGDAADFSLSYAYHRDQNVNYAVTVDPSQVDPERGPVVAVWDRLHTIGFDFETTDDGIGYRGEFTYVVGKSSVTRDITDSDLLKQRDTISTLLGVDYTFENGLYANVQIIQDVILNRESLMFNQAYEGSVTSRIRKRFMRELLTLEFTGRAFYTHRDFFIHAGGTYELLEGLEAEARFDLFEGSSDRLFGQFDDNDQFLLGLKYFF